MCIYFEFFCLNCSIKNYAFKLNPLLGCIQRSFIIQSYILLKLVGSYNSKLLFFFQNIFKNKNIFLIHFNHSHSYFVIFNIISKKNQIQRYIFFNALKSISYFFNYMLVPHRPSPHILFQIQFQSLNTKFLYINVILIYFDKMKHQLSLDTRTLYLQSQNKLQNKFQNKINVNKLNFKKKHFRISQ